MFTTDQLLRWNEMMVGRGAPVERDDTGYNQGDYVVCQNYFYGLSNAQFSDLANRLVKYCNTQLHVSKEEMMETANHFKQLAKEVTDAQKAISVSIEGDFTIVAFKYNKSYVSVIQAIDKQLRNWNAELKVWKIHNCEVLNTLNKLKEIGADVDNAIEYLNENLPQTNKIIMEVNNTKEFKNIKQMNSIVIQAEKHGKNRVEVTLSKYNKAIIETIKGLDDRKYDATTKGWNFPQKDARQLIDKLRSFQDVEFSSLEAFILDEVVEEVIPPLQLKDYSYLTRNPFDYQFEGAQFLLNKKKALLADDMGLGKTFQALMASNTIQGKKLIVCPASLKLNWEKEIRIINKEDTVKIIEGSQWQTLKGSKSNGWIIINYDILNKHIEKILKEGFAVAIFDEAHYCKAISNSGKPASKRAEMMLKIARKLEYVFLLTGTPITNATKDVFNLLKAINHPLSNKFHSFAHRYCDPTNNGWGWNYNGSSNQKELNERLQSHMLRRLKTDKLNLPDKIRSFIPVQIDLREYWNKVDEYMMARKSFSTFGEHLVYMNAMRHILAKHKAKHSISLAKDLIDQNQSVIIFTNYTDVVNQVCEAFQGNIVKVTGDLSTKQKQESVDRFQNGEVPVIVCNVKAGGAGITLTKSSNTIVNDFDWVFANHDQAESRNHRIGQDQSVNIQYIYSLAPIDAHMAEILEEKLLNSSLIVDGTEESFAKEVLSNVFR